MSHFQRDLAQKLFAVFAGLASGYIGGTALMTLEFPKNSTVRSTFSATAGLAIFGLTWSFAPYWFAPPAQVPDQPHWNLTDGVPDAPPPEPPETFPSLASSGLKPLSDDDRDDPNYRQTTVVIRNETRKAIVLAYSYVPRPQDTRLSTYAHRVTQVIPAGEMISDERDNFGGPVQLSVLFNQKWTPMNTWYQFGVVAKRTVIVTEGTEGFRCTVRLEEEIP